VQQPTKYQDLIVVWDISQINYNVEPVIIAKQTSEYNIKQIKFSPKHNEILVSCGRENIRYWLIK